MAADNSAILRAGSARAKAIIADDITRRLDRLMADMVSSMERDMKMKVPGMTGNTQVSPAGAVYVHGQLQSVDLGQGRKEALRQKLRKGEVFPAGSVRYDGDRQEKTFTAKVPTSGDYQVTDNYAFLESQQSGSSEFKATVVGGTEYLGHVQVHDSFARCQDQIASYFKPSGK